MRFSAWLTASIYAATGFAASVHKQRDISLVAVANTSRKYLLTTQLRPGQDNKARFNGLYAYSFHTGAGISDVVFNQSRDDGPLKGYLNSTGTALEGGQNSNTQLFDLNANVALAMVVAFANTFESAWEPVRIRAGAATNPTDPSEVTGFFINQNGLQWRNLPSTESGFGGWIVCEWWHKAPQLFARVARYLQEDAPCNCADVDLIPEYI